MERSEAYWRGIARCPIEAGSSEVESTGVLSMLFMVLMVFGYSVDVPR